MNIEDDSARRRTTVFEPDRLIQKVKNDIQELKFENKLMLEQAGQRIAEHINTGIDKRSKGVLTASTNPLDKVLNLKRDPGDNVFKLAETFTEDVKKAMEPIAKENTQSKVLNSLGQLTKVNEIAKNTMFSGLKALNTTNTTKLNDVGNKLAIVAKKVSPLDEKLKIANKNALVATEATKENSSNVQNLLTLMGEWFAFDRARAAYEKMRGDVSTARRYGRGFEGPGIASRMYREVVPYGSKLDSALESLKGFITGTVDAMESTGRGIQWLVQGLVNLFTKGKLGSTLRVLRKEGNPLTKALLHIGEWVWHLRYFAIGIAAILGGAAIKSLIETPGMMTRYIEAFSDLWSKSIGPAFAWLGDKLEGWWSGEGGESSFTKMGDIINNTLIYTIGTALPALLNTLGRGILDIADLLGGLVDFVHGVFSDVNEQFWKYIYSFAGLFGYGPNKDEPLLENLFQVLGGSFVDLVGKLLKRVDDLVYDVASFIVSSTDNLATGIIDILGISSLLGFQDGETVSQAIPRMVNQLGNYLLSEFNRVVDDITMTVGNIWNDIVSTFNEYYDSFGEWLTKARDNVLGTIIGIFESFERKVAGLFSGMDISLADKIFNKMTSIFDYIMDFIPSVDDLKELLLGAISKLPFGDAAGDFLRKRVFGMTETTHTPPRVGTPVVDESRNIYSKALEEMSKANQFMGGTVVINNADNSVKSSVSNRTVGSGGPTVHTRPSVSGWDLKALGVDPMLVSP